MFATLKEEGLARCAGKGDESYATHYDVGKRDRNGNDA
jgi:hypothetical protein